DRIRLFLASFLMLFVELVLIRWSGANVVYLSFFSNFVLLGSFLGIGLGFLLGSARWNLFRWAPVILATFITITRVFHVTINRGGSQLIFFGAFRPEGLPIWLTLPIVFAVVALTMVAIAQGVAKLFATFPPLDAYRLDILGSIAGIAAFGTLSLLGAGPVWWAIV